VNFCDRVAYRLKKHDRLDVVLIPLINDLELRHVEVGA